MWHEARKQEKMIRGMIVDYRRRAERRKDFYEKIKADPTQFLQIHGRPCKIHLDPAVAMAGEGPAIMMQWQGDPSNMIDRFDVRAHLDYIPDMKIPEVLPENLGTEERHCNYERYRILAQNAFLGMNEDRFLQQLSIEEQFGVTIEEKDVQREKLNEKKGTGVAIGYNYNDPGAQLSSSNGSEDKKMDQKDKDSDDDSDLEILDVDLSLDVNKMEPLQAHELNAIGPYFGMTGCDLFSFLTGDADDAEHQKQMMIEEKEKAMYSGRKSRRERRAHRDKKLATRVVSPPSYAAPSLDPEKAQSRSPSRSPSPEAAGLIEFITSFGGEEEEAKPLSSKALYSEKVKQNLKNLELYSEVAKKQRQRSPMSEEGYPCPIGPRGPNSRSKSKSRSPSKSRSTSLSRSRTRKSRSRSRKSRSRSHKSRSRSRESRSSSRKSRSKSRKPLSRSRSRSRARKSRSRSRYTSRSRSSMSHSRSRSRSKSRNYRSRRSRSPNYSKRKKSRSMSYNSSSDRGGSTKARVPRYYGRKKDDKSSSDLSLDSGSSDSEVVKNKLAVGNKSNANQNVRSSGSSSKVPSRDTQSLKDKLKKKMQAQLSRQLRADKRAAAEREERESRRQARRDEEMRELAIKLRRKQREMRHRFRRSSDESDRSRSNSSSRDSTGEKKPSRSKSRSPPEKRLPVWEKNAAPYKTTDIPPNKTTDPPLPPLPPLYTVPPPPFIRKRIPEEEFIAKPYFQERRERSRTPSPNRRIPVWEAQREPFRPQGVPFPDYRRPRYQENDRSGYRYENPRRYDNRFEPIQQNPYDNRWDSNTRRPYGNRGGYRGYSRPPPPGVGPNWQRDQDCDEGDKSKVKLVDY